MTDWLPLNIFPPGGLASSVITTVWVGVCVVAFLNLRFGTTLSGLVVPGYLIPLLLVRPISAGVVLLEGVVTYCLGRLLAEYLPKRFGLSELFGRDRFFALVLISVLVRIVFDASLLPQLGDFLSLRAGIDYDFQSNLHSFGLIIVALIANQFWNGGFRQGTVAIFLYLSITYIIVRFVLMELTNFNINTLSYMYEDLASSILASPKAYILLLTSAFIASRMNLKYGWEYNGILIPSLLALQWYQPGKLLATFVEAFVVLFAARALLRFPWLRNHNIEGARQLLLFFSISFVYKIILGFALLDWSPESKITDYYGFGYLLATLMALKMYQKNVAVLLTRASIQTSLTAVLIASAIGFSLTLLPQPSFLLPEQTEDSRVEPVYSQQPLTYFHRQLARSFESDGRRNYVPPTALQLDQTRIGFEHLKRYLNTRAANDLQQATSVLGAAGWKLELINGRYLVVSEQASARGWGWYVINLRSDSPLALEVPAALDETIAAETAIWMLLQNAPKTLAVAGVRRYLNSDGASDVLLNPATSFQIFHQIFGRENTFQLRTYTSANTRALLGKRSPAILSLDNTPAQLWISRQLPEGLNLAQMRERVDELTVTWQPAPFPNRQRDTVQGGFAELFINPFAIKQWAEYRDLDSLVSVSDQRRIDGYLQTWLTESKSLIAERGSNKYQTPELGALIFFDELIVSPLTYLARQNLSQGWRGNFRAELTRLSLLAQTYNYELIHYHHPQSQSDYLILHEPLSRITKRRFWGTYVFRLGAASPFIIQVPHPFNELNTFELGTTFFEELKASVLMIGGAHTYANGDGSSHLTASANKESLFNLVYQVLFREAGESPLAAVQIRGFGDADTLAGTSADAMLAGYYPDTVGFWSTPVLSTLKSLGVSTVMVEGKLQTRGYEVPVNAQLLYLPIASNKQMMTLWVAPEARRQFQATAVDIRESARFRSLGIETMEAPIGPQIAELKPTPVEINSVADRLKPLIKAYIESENVTFLSTAKTMFPRLRQLRITDPNTLQAFLLISDPQGRLVLVANLQPAQAGTLDLSNGKQGIEAIADQASSFARSRQTFLIWSQSE
ncbi:poly-gamma-glutamate biosynthesis protein PgsC/CapC [Marinobacter caseinilyticus]|uniref:poly-gamma-glutamate biosynthesis protein PgsC/CapC n=1 Tax=Marinobacter caseinilyticus TaxID=2692195 RepID=UPI001407F62B|nr:poly-gamma-glutamate biosynthesis protein PgsC/CapC [Marinobacter caseinilyticus]